MKFLVPVSSIIPHCSFPISLLIFPVALNTMMFRINLITCLIRLMVRCNSHAVAPGFFGSAMKINLLSSSGISPLSYTLLTRSIRFSMLKSSEDVNISVRVSSGPAALFRFIFSNADSTSDFTMLGPSMFLFNGWLVTSVIFEQIIDVLCPPFLCLLFLCDDVPVFRLCAPRRTCRSTSANLFHFLLHSCRICSSVLLDLFAFCVEPLRFCFSVSRRDLLIPSLIFLLFLSDVSCLPFISSSISDVIHFRLVSLSFFGRTFLAAVTTVSLTFSQQDFVSPSSSNVS